MSPRSISVKKPRKNRFPVEPIGSGCGPPGSIPLAGRPDQFYRSLVQAARELSRLRNRGSRVARRSGLSTTHRRAGGRGTRRRRESTSGVSMQRGAAVLVARGVATVPDVECGRDQHDRNAGGATGPRSRAVGIGEVLRVMRLNVEPAQKAVAGLAQAIAGAIEPADVSTRSGRNHHRL